MNRTRVFAALTLALLSPPSMAAAASSESCGEVIGIETHNRTTTRYALARAEGAPAKDGPVALVLLPGGGGYLNLDDKGCPRALRGNSLVRSLPLFHEAGFVTALVDSPSNYTGDEGLGGFRISPQHAADLGRVIADVRERTKAAVWVVGTSRGAISAVNAASRLTGTSAPDGVVLTSALMVGTPSGKLVWTGHTVFSLPLDAIKQPVLVVGHAADNCLRSPATLMSRIVERTNGVREQVVTVTGGPGTGGAPDLNACEGRTPHGFLDQEAEVAAGIARFIRGGTY
jgi:hypothetical protein